MTESLEDLRKSVAAADLAISRALEARLRIARRIGQVKRTTGLPLRDYLTERRVMEGWRGHLEKIEIPPERADLLSRWIIEESVRVQELLPDRRPPQGTSSEVLVVGGAGAMGRWMTGLLESSGHRVNLADPRAPGAARTPLRVQAKRAEIVVVATPMRAAPSVYREILASKTRAVVFDILSLKKPILPLIRRGIRQGFRFTSTHPLFGPSVRTLSGRNLLILDCGNEEANRVAERLFVPTSLTITRLPVELHDKIISDTLALPHLVSLAFALTVAQRRWPEGHLSRAAPTSYVRQAETARIIAAENPELSFDIQALSPESRKLFARVDRALAEVRAAVENEDRPRFQRLLRKAAGVLEERS